ncbi:MAG TPA: alpha/beta hydrolase domain-containing protein [Steroidobacteraceae bacterium]|nr:alpha/beta hydrolase domain-containing protein [Steroidobacteraceae bacterium]
MVTNNKFPLLRSSLLILASAGWVAPVAAHVASIVIDSPAAPAFAGAPIGTAGAYVTLKGRVFGELDPRDHHNVIIQDLELAPKDVHGMVHYTATFQITMPADLSKASGLMFNEVANRGGNAIPSTAAAVVPGAIYLESGWQGDLLAHCATDYPCTSLDVPFTGSQQVIQVPVAKNRDGSTLTGPVYGHIANATGNTAQMIIFTTPVPYQPLSMDTKKTEFWSLESQTITGVDGAKTPIPSTDWAWADCSVVPFPGTPDPTRICLRNGFNSNLLYEMVFTAKNPLVLGVGYAATRDIISFFHHASADNNGTANPVADAVRKVITVGSSQSGSFIRSSIHLGFNQDEQNRQVVDGAWPQIDGRQLYMNVRFALPDVITNLYMMADEAPVWWAHYPDKARHLPANGLLDRCTETRTCPEVLETFGSLEFYDEKMSPDLIGFTAEEDIPLPHNVHRYYYPATTHGGGSGGFNFVANPAPANGCVFPANPNPESDTNNALQDDFVALVMHGTRMPQSSYPTLRDRLLVPATQKEEGFPNIPKYPFQGNQINFAELFDFGRDIDLRDQTGIVTIQPPLIDRVLPTYAVKVNSDGNEFAGVKSVLLQAPLATYTGWNTVAAGIYKGQQCGLTASSFPFQETKAQRVAAQDPRPSIEERYGTHQGYVCVVSNAAGKSVRQRVLRESAATTLIAQAQAGNVLADITPTDEDQALAKRLCAPPGKDGKDDDRDDDHDGDQNGDRSGGDR